MKVPPRLMIANSENYSLSWWPPCFCKTLLHLEMNPLKAFFINSGVISSSQTLMIFSLRLCLVVGMGCLKTWYFITPHTQKSSTDKSGE